ncbi:transmembrane protein 173 [Nesidiocoris tenuis]|uniref:Transmembrane protein 173 n=1 Tax=Nesidiocoris tenuis TaxID=355587 RepID=A0ABN7AJF9_9HEMI|nr:transmembrane protein 173 [Nesidiocoris tenuis]
MVWRSWACAVCVVATLAFFWRSKKSSKFNQDVAHENFDYLSKWGLDYASAMVDSYFYGYLHLVLPPNLADNVGFEKRVQMYKRDQKLTDNPFPNKMFVVVHKSGFSPNSYEDELPDVFWARNKLVFDVEGRSGIRRRTYQSPVYRVKTNFDSPSEINVVVEGAQCLRQLYESSLRNPVVKEFSGKIIQTFMDKMTEKIENDPQCRGKCELIFLDDSPGSEHAGRAGYEWLASELIRRTLPKKSS